MATDDSYEIMPYKEIIELKKQISELQKKTGDTSSKELLESMAALTKSMNSMLQLFSAAAEEMKLEEKTESELTKQITPLIDKVNSLEEQNKTIAEGLVAVADMVKDLRGEKIRREREFRPTMSKEKLPEKKILPPPSMGPRFESSSLPPLEPQEQEESLGPDFANFDSDLPPLDSELPSLEPPELPPLEPPQPTNPNFMQRQPYRGPMPPPGMPQRGQMPPFPGGPMPPRGQPMDFGSLPPLPPLEERPKKGMFGLFKK